MIKRYYPFNKKKGIISYDLINIFCSKKGKTIQIDQLTDIEILFKGRIRRSGDYTRYFIRFTFRDGEKIEFGECLTFRRISEKVKIKKFNLLIYFINSIGNALLY